MDNMVIKLQINVKIAIQHVYNVAALMLSNVLHVLEHIIISKMDATNNVQLGHS